MSSTAETTTATSHRTDGPIRGLIRWASFNSIGDVRDYFAERGFRHEGDDGSATMVRDDGDYVLHVEIFRHGKADAFPGAIFSDCYEVRTVSEVAL